MTALFSHSTSGAQEFLNSFYIGINIESILLGFALFLYFQTLGILLSKRNARQKSSLFYALFSSVMVLSITVWVATEALLGQKTWLLHASFPGGPYAYSQTNLLVWYMEWSRVEVVLLQLMTDGLLIYRCRIIWNSNRVVVVPVILWLATLTLGVLLAWTNSLPGSNFDTGLSGQVTLAYWSTSVFLNTTLTCMICYRVLRHGRIMQRHFGNEYASLYFTVAAVIIESVLPYTLSGVAFLVSLGMGSPIYVGFICVYLPMMCISPLMLILRVISGSAWDNDTFNPPGSTVMFSPDTRDTFENFGSRFLDSSGVRGHV